MRSFSINIEINAPPEQVWKVMSDVQRWPEWTPSVINVVPLDGEELKLGRRARIRQPKLLPAIWTVTDLQPGRSFTWKSAGPGFSVTGEHSVEGRETSSRAMLSLFFGGVLGGVLGRMLRDLNQSYLEMEAEGLKRRCESLFRASQRDR